MRIQKEIANVENIKNRQPVEPLTMEDAVRTHKAAIDRIEKDRKDVNKELGIEGIEEKGFTGASKEPKKVSTPELKKMKLAESLFEELEETDGWTEEVQDILSEVLEDIQGLKYELDNCIRGAYTDCKTAEELSAYVEVLATGLQFAAEQLMDNASHLNEAATIKAGDLVGMDSDEVEAERERQEEEERKRQEEERARAEEEQRKADEKAKNDGDSAWGEKDWVKERQKAREKAGRDDVEPDMDGYTDTEKEAIRQRLRDFDNDAEAQARYKRKADAKAAEEKEKKEKEAEEKRAARRDRTAGEIEKAGQAIKDMPGKLRNAGRGVGINLKY